MRWEYAAVPPAARDEDRMLAYSPLPIQFLPTELIGRRGDEGRDRLNVNAN